MVKIKYDNKFFCKMEKNILSKLENKIQPNQLNANNSNLTDADKNHIMHTMIAIFVMKGIKVRYASLKQVILDKKTLNNPATTKNSMEKAEYLSMLNFMLSSIENQINDKYKTPLSINPNHRISPS